MRRYQGVQRTHFANLDEHAAPAQAGSSKCLLCSGPVEASPVLSGVCAECYRTKVAPVDLPASTQTDLAYGVCDLDGRDFLDLRRTEEDARY